jgi:hypothetical protein
LKCQWRPCHQIKELIQALTQPAKKSKIRLKKKSEIEIKKNLVQKIGHKVLQSKKLQESQLEDSTLFLLI